MRDLWKKIFFVVVGIFALIGLLFTIVFIGMQLGLLNVRGSSAERNAFFGPLPSDGPCDIAGETVCAWNSTPEWDTVSGGLEKDAEVITTVSKETGVSARMIAAVVIPEQLRFFTSEREIFKSYFEPLKILGSLSQFSLGVSGIKEDTADEIEQDAGADAPLIAYPATTTPHDTLLYNRLTDPKDHYYSYLYTALYIKEIEAQWKQAGFDISQNPGIVATLFNIGFANSHPNGSPHVGGAPIAIGGTTYLFGELGADFYNSAELASVFPK